MHSWNTHSDARMTTSEEIFRDTAKDESSEWRENIYDMLTPNPTFPSRGANDSKRDKNSTYDIRGPLPSRSARRIRACSSEEIPRRERRSEPGSVPHYLVKIQIEPRQKRA